MSRLIRLYLRIVRIPSGPVWSLRRPAVRHAAVPPFWPAAVTASQAAPPPPPPSPPPPPLPPPPSPGPHPPQTPYPKKGPPKKKKNPTPPAAPFPPPFPPPPPPPPRSCPPEAADPIHRGHRGHLARNFDEHGLVAWSRDAVDRELRSCGQGARQPIWRPSWCLWRAAEGLTWSRWR